MEERFKSIVSKVLGEISIFKKYGGRFTSDTEFEGVFLGQVDDSIPNTLGISLTFTSENELEQGLIMLVKGELELYPLVIVQERTNFEKGDYCRIYNNYNIKNKEYTIYPMDENGYYTWGEKIIKYGK